MSEYLGQMINGRLGLTMPEYSIRPLAIGRKNYLVAGSQNGARTAAMLYSFIGTCKINDVNPFEWLKNTLETIPQHPVNKLYELIPRKV